MVTVKASGLDELRRNLRQVKDKALDDELKAIHKELAEEVVAKALPNVPVRSGALKGTVRAAGTKKDAIGRAGGASVVYAPIQHWGWEERGIKSRPFLREAAQSVEAGLVERYDRQVAAMLDRIVRD